MRIVAGGGSITNNIIANNRTILSGAQGGAIAFTCKSSAKCLPVKS